MANTVDIEIGSGALRRALRPCVVVCPIRPADRRLISNAVSYTSPETYYRRFTR